jgi:hypothetical protein
MRFAIPVLLAAACGAKANPPSTTASNEIYGKKTIVTWGIKPGAGGKLDVFLQTTDETGAQTSYPLGSYTGDCNVIAPVAEMKAATGVACSGVELDAVTTETEIIVLKGSGGDPMSRIEVMRVKAPGGSKIEVAP